MGLENVSWRVKGKDECNVCAGAGAREGRTRGYFGWAGLQGASFEGRVVKRRGWKLLKRGGKEEQVKLPTKHTAQLTKEGRNR